MVPRNAENNNLFTDQFHSTVGAQFFIMRANFVFMTYSWPKTKDQIRTYRLSLRLALFAWAECWIEQICIQTWLHVLGFPETTMRSFFHAFAFHNSPVNSYAPVNGLSYGFELAGGAVGDTGPPMTKIKRSHTDKRQMWIRYGWIEVNFKFRCSRAEFFSQYVTGAAF